MYKYKTLDDRQLLLEEIYAELEDILLNKEGNATEEEEHNEIEDNQAANIEEEEDNDQNSIKRILREIQQFDPSNTTKSKRKRFIYNLINELKDKKSLLQQSLKQINSIIQANGL